MDTDRREIEFLRPLGVGGFGAVYLANLHGRDRFVRRVAVKVMREGLDSTPDLVARQKDEARLLGLLAHEGIVQVLDLAEVQGRPAVVMEYVEGVDLSEVLKHTHPERFPVRAALEVVACVAGALDAAFNSVSALTGQPLRVIHRDIKPANMLLTASGRVKVLDFGVAKADFARDGHTTNMGWGTPRFMAPEQWLGEPYGAAIDIYALGVTLFDLVADRGWERPPLTRTPFEAHVAAQLDAQRDVPEAVLALIAEMTAFDATDRPTPAEVRERAEAAMLDAPGQTLARYARAVVPALVEAKSRTSANQPVPPPITLGSASGASAIPPREEPSIAVPETQPQPTGLPLWLLPAGVAAFVALGVVGLAAVLAFGLARGPEEPSTALQAAAEGTPPTDMVQAEDEATTGAGAELDGAAGLPGAAGLENPEGLAANARPDIPTSAGSAVTPTTRADKGASTKAKATPPPPKEPEGGGKPDVSPPTDPPPSTPPPTEPAKTAGMAAGAGATTGASAAPEAPVAQYPVTITSRPTSAAVYVDGKLVGDTALRNHQLSAGKHTIRVVLGGESSPDKTLTVSGPIPELRYDFEQRAWRFPK